MGVTLNQITYDIMESIKGRLSDDDDFDIRQVEFWVKTQRAIWLRNEFNKNHTIDENFIQDLGCLDLELVSDSSCCGITTDCKILRTVEEIPVAIELNDRQAITRVGSVNMGIKMTQADFNFVSYNRAKYVGNDRYTKNQIYSFLFNKRIYIFSNGSSLQTNLLSKANVRGVFEDPTELRAFTTCTGTACYTNESDYPINAWLVDYIKGYILKNYAALVLNQRIDTTNDAANTNAQIQPVQQQQ